MNTARAVLLTSFLLLQACAPGANVQTGTANAKGVVAGFWRGVWHGMIVPVTFVVSLFTDDVGVYEARNNGGWYDFGFMIGINAALGGHAATRRRRTTVVLSQT